MHTIDLNCDLGEGCPNDAELMSIVSSANIACGGHAGDVETMRRTVALALENNVAIGIHVGYDDRENFGRTDLDLSFDEIRGLVAEQSQRLRTICDEIGAVITHLKPHGALYNQAAKDAGKASAIIKGMLDAVGAITFYGLSGSVMLDEARKAGLPTAAEVFADRTYQNDGSLTPRTRADALVSDEARALEQVLDMVRYKRVRTTDAIMIPIVAETVCIHGDGPHAVPFARLIRNSLEAAGIAVRHPFRS